ncbi:MAG: hypothetical protein R3Y43_06060 [Alphaproteobacteria bacterium]
MSSIKTAKMLVSLSFVCVLMLGVTMFVMKYNVQGLERELININKEISQDIRSIHVLKAEWAHLNSPERLKILASKHAKLKNLEAEQIINYSVLPLALDEQRIDNSSNQKYKRLTAQER